jgi:hypothetical protein
VRYWMWFFGIVLPVDFAVVGVVHATGYDLGLWGSLVLGFCVGILATVIASEKAA